jgi:hypothetical protein
MPDRVEHRLAAFPTTSKAALLWKQFFGSMPPAQLRRDLMIQMFLIPKNSGPDQ